MLLLIKAVLTLSSHTRAMNAKIICNIAKRGIMKTAMTGTTYGSKLAGEHAATVVNIYIVYIVLLI